MNALNACPCDYEPEIASKKPRKFPAVTPELHEKIKQLYICKKYNSGEVEAFARRHGLPRWKVTRYARAMAWQSKHPKQPNWTERELEILERSAHHGPETIRKRLSKAGFDRTVMGIILKRKRMRFLQNLNGQSARSFAMCLGEDEHFVTRAISLGLLRASRRDLGRTPQQGGNPYLIKDSAAREFIRENVHMIDFRKIDKYWLVDLLAGGE
jgi:hypothetical protein